jgi:pilus assembly protein CpaF
MFGKRTDSSPAAPAAVPSVAAQVPKPAAAAAVSVPETRVQAAVTPTSDQRQRSENYYDIKSTIFNALIDAIDLTQLAQLDRGAARDEIRDIVNEIIAIKDVVMSIAELCWRAMTSPTLWSMVPRPFSSKSAARCRRPVFASATTASF